jgi:SAM-dependent methyltransferase
MGGNRSPVGRLAGSMRVDGPLATLHKCLSALECSFPDSSRLRSSLLKLDSVLASTDAYVDARFDRRHGTDTGGVISLGTLAIPSSHVELATRYEATSARRFGQIMKNLHLDWADFTFVDFGSGKGRVLLLASEFPFRRVIGVEFAPELNAVARKNVEVWCRTHPGCAPIEVVQADAATFPIPTSPLVAFFFSPFYGELMERVIENITASWSAKPRPVHIVFYGTREDTIEMLRGTGFTCNEVKLPREWARVSQYRLFLLASPEPAAAASASTHD